MTHSFVRAIEIHQLPAIINTSRSPRPNAKNRFEELRPPCADETVQAENFPFANVERDVVQLRRKFCRKMLNRKNRLSRDIIKRRETRFERSSDHRGD